MVLEGRPGKPPAGARAAPSLVEGLAALLEQAHRPCALLDRTPGSPVGAHAHAHECWALARARLGAPQTPRRCRLRAPAAVPAFPTPRPSPAHRAPLEGGRGSMQRNYE